MNDVRGRDKVIIRVRFWQGGSRSGLVCLPPRTGALNGLVLAGRTEKMGDACLAFGDAGCSSAAVYGLGTLWCILLTALACKNLEWRLFILGAGVRWMSGGHSPVCHSAIAAVDSIPLWRWFLAASTQGGREESENQRRRNRVHMIDVWPLRLQRARALPAGRVASVPAEHRTSGPGRHLADRQEGNQPRFPTHT